jgi:hypothetical protein
MKELTIILNCLGNAGDVRDTPAPQREVVSPHEEPQLGTLGTEGDSSHYGPLVPTIQVRFGDDSCVSKSQALPIVHNVPRGGMGRGDK